MQRESTGGVNLEFPLVKRQSRPHVSSPQEARAALAASCDLLRFAARRSGEIEAAVGRAFLLFCPPGKVSRKQTCLEGARKGSASFQGVQLPFKPKRGRAAAADQFVPDPHEIRRSLVHWTEEGTGGLLANSFSEFLVPGLLALCSI